MIPFYVNEISHFNLRTKSATTIKAFNEEKKKNEQMENVVASCLQSLQNFRDLKLQMFSKWKHLSRLCDRALIFEEFLRDLGGNPQILNDLSNSENEILLGIQKSFRMVENLVNEMKAKKVMTGFTELQLFQSHFTDVAVANGMISQYGEALNIIEDPDLTQIRYEDLEVRMLLGLSLGPH